GIRGFLFSQGITDYDPLRKDRRSRLGQLTTGTLPRNSPAAGMGVRLPDRLKARSRKEPKKRESEAGKVPNFVAALANLPPASCSGKNVLAEPLRGLRSQAPVLTKFESSLQPGLINTRPGDDGRGY